MIQPVKEKKSWLISNRRDHKICRYHGPGAKGDKAFSFVLAEGEENLSEPHTESSQENSRDCLPLIYLRVLVQKKLFVCIADVAAVVNV